MDLPPLPPEAGWARALKPLAFGLLAGVLISLGLNQLPDTEALWVVLLLSLATACFCWWMLLDLRRQRQHMQRVMRELEQHLRRPPD